MSKIPTSKELFDQFYQEQLREGTADGSLWEYEEDIKNLAIKLTRFHVKAALKEALESIPCIGSSTDIPSYEEVEKAVLNSYPSKNIK